MSDQTQVQEPEGVSFFSIKTGETHFGKLEPTIAAYINSSDMGINASRGQNYGWRLHPDWVAKIKAFRRNPTQMSILTSKYSGQKPNTVQILYYLYGEQLQAYYESMEENENPFEEKYARMIANGGIDPEDPIDDSAVPAALADFLAANEEEIDEDDDEIANIIDDAIAEESPAPEPEKKGEPETPKPKAPKQK